MSVPVLTWLFSALGKAAELRPPTRHAASQTAVRAAREGRAVHSRMPRFRQETPRPNRQSQSLSRSYGSILPTSLIYIVLSTRGYSPWRPDAVMSTTRGVNKYLPQIFKGRRERTEHRKDYGALPCHITLSPYNTIPGSLSS